MVIITFIYVIATIFICIYNRDTVKATREQLEEMRTQFNIINRPNIVIELIYTKRLWIVRLTNIGTKVAYKVAVTFDKDFINKIPDTDLKEIIEKDHGRKKSIGVGKYYDYIVGTKEYMLLKNKPPIKGSVSYYDIMKTSYSENFQIDVENYSEVYLIPTGLSQILCKHCEAVQNRAKIFQGGSGVSCCRLVYKITAV